MAALTESSLLLTDRFWVLLTGLSLFVLLISYGVGLAVRWREPNYLEFFGIILAPGGLTSGLKMTLLSSEIYAVFQGKPQGVLLDSVSLGLAGVVMVIFSFAAALKLVVGAWEPVQ